MILTRMQRNVLRRCLALLELNRLQFAWSILAGFLGLGCSVGLAAVSAWLIAKASTLPPVLDLSVAAVSVRALGVGKALFRYLNRLASHHVALYGMAGLRSRIYDILADSSADVITSIRRGDLLSRTGQDIDTVGDLVVRALQPACVAVSVSLLSVVMVGAFSPAVGLALLLGLIVAGVVAPWCAMRGAYLAEAEQIRVRSELSALSLTMLEHADELRVHGSLGGLERHKARVEKSIFSIRDRAARPSALAAALTTASMGVVVFVAIVVGGREAASGQLGLLELAIVVLTPLAAFEATDPMPMAAIQLLRSASAGKRVLELIDRAQAPTLAATGYRVSTTEENVNSPESAQAQATLPEPASPAHTLKAHGLVLGWPGGRDISEPLNLTLAAGRSLAIVGPSGIGKSTLLYTLAGMIRPHGGKVSIDGFNPADYPRSQVARYISMTAEDAHIFATTVLENIRVGRPDVSEEEARELLSHVGLDTWLSQLPNGVNTLIGAGATSISGGERRRLLLARALASNAGILLLDEPGEHIDAHTADALISDLLTTGEQASRILVTHRLSPLGAADHVIMLGMEKGKARVIAQGTHEELIATCKQYAWALSQEEQRG